MWIELLALFGSLVLGAALGLFYFWGLWITLRGIEDSRRPAARVLLSLVVRLCLVVACFALLVRYASWGHLIAGLAGFTIARLLAVGRLQLEGEDR